MAKHTSGPWQWMKFERAGGIYLATPDRGQLIVMDCVRQGMQAGQPRFAIWEGDERGRLGGIMKPAEILNLADHPDARLIAVAPELLAACKGVADLLNAHDWGEGPALRAINAAIAKAEGR